MRRHIPGLHSGQHDLVSNLDGLFLVRVERASYRWHPQKPFFALRFGILEPTSHEALSFSGRLYCTDRALWKLRWFLHDFGYDAELPLIFVVSSGPVSPASTDIPTRTSMRLLRQRSGRHFPAP
jgi:hypothetical protein